MLHKCCFWVRHAYGNYIFPKNFCVITLIYIYIYISDYIWKWIIFGITFGEMHELLAWKIWASFIWSSIRKSWILWYIGKFKDAYLVLLFGKLIENLFDNNEVENLTNFVEVRLFKVFLNLPGYKLCIWKEM